MKPGGFNWKDLKQILFAIGWGVVVFKLLDYVAASKDDDPSMERLVIFILGVLVPLLPIIIRR